MNRMDFEELNQWINERKADVEKEIVSKRTGERKFRTRERDADEIKILDRLCIERWKRAEQAGKIKYISKQVWYYEFD